MNLDSQLSNILRYLSLLHRMIVKWEFWYVSINKRKLPIVTCNTQTSPISTELFCVIES